MRPIVTGVTNESYFTNWRPPNWRLAQDRYRVEVTIRCENATCKGVFLLINEANLSNQFRLEECSDPERLLRTRSRLDVRRH